MKDFLACKPCVRFHSSEKTSDSKNAIIYLKLLKSGCSRGNALKFSSKNICKLDVSRSIDGPSNFRILKTKSNPLFSFNVF